MNLYPLELEANLIQIVVLIALVVWRILRLKNPGNVTHHLFMCGMISHLVLNIYWTVALVLEIDQANLMFKASDTGAIAMFLFWFSMFQSKCRIKLKNTSSFSLIPLFAFFFGIWNAVWWNLWNLNLITNTLWAVCTTLLIYAIFYSLDYRKAITEKTAIIMLAMVIVLFVFEIRMYISPSKSTMYIISDWICFAAWAVLICLSLMAAFRNRRRRTVWLFSALIFSMFAEYLSDGLIYSLFMIAESLIIALLLIFFDEKDFEEETA